MFVIRMVALWIEETITSRNKNEEILQLRFILR